MKTIHSFAAVPVAAAALEGKTVVKFLLTVGSFFMGVKSADGNDKFQRKMEIGVERVSTIL